MRDAATGEHRPCQVASPRNPGDPRVHAPRIGLARTPPPRCDLGRHHRTLRRAPPACFARHLAQEGETAPWRPRGAPSRGRGAPADAYDVLVAGGAWDLPGGVPRLHLTVVLAALGARPSWWSLRADGRLSRSLGLAPASFGIARLWTHDVAARHPPGPGPGEAARAAARVR